MNSMSPNEKHFYKYITVSGEDKNWGLYITGTGYNEVSGKTPYPLTDHPAHHYFNWSAGRRLSDYQMLYITRGKGIFESEASGTQRIKSGDLFILFPNIWHRFCPDKDTGWNENWIEFNGEVISHFMEKNILDPGKPVIPIGLDGSIITNFNRVVDLVKEDSITLQYIASGIIYQLLGQVFALLKAKTFENSSIEKQIRQAKLKIQERLEATISPENIAREIGLGYSLFRKEFRKHTGFSPVQYQIQLKIQKARILLSSTNLPIKIIAQQTGFESSNYFSRLFKQRMGMTPLDYRSRNRR